MHGRHHGIGAGLSWWPSERERLPEREPLTRDQIVTAAIKIIDSEGLEALSMRRLGQELEAGATSLYWHVKNKDQLLDLVLDAIIGEVPLDDDPSLAWQERVAHLARGLRAVLIHHHNAAVVFGSRVTIGPNALTAVEHLLGIFRAAGFEGVDLGLAYQTVLNFAVGFAVFETRPVSGEGSEGKSEEELQALVGQMLGSLPADRYPNLVALARATGQLSSEAQFEYGLQRLLDGMDADLRRKRVADEGGTPSPVGGESKGSGNEPHSP